MSINPKRQVSLIILSTVMAAFSLGSIISFSDPGSASRVTFCFLYVSLMLFSVGIFTLLGLGLRNLLSPGLYVINFTASLRQGLLISALIIASFILLSMQLLFWWVELSLILFLSAIEIFLNLKI